MSEIVKCPFCIIQSRIIKSNDLAILFYSNPHITEGHLLVCPKRHVEEPWELTEKEILYIFSLIFFAEKKLLGKIGGGFDIRQNYRPFMKQDKVKVDHVHFHIIPRTYEDKIYQVSEKNDNELWKSLSDEESDNVRKLIQ